MKRLIIFSVMALCSQLSLGQHLFEPWPPPCQKLPDRSNMAEWWRTNLIVPAFVGDVSFWRTGNSYLFTVPSTNLVADLPGRFEVYLNFEPTSVSQICVRCETPFGIDVVSHCLANQSNEGRVVSPCPSNNGRFSSYLAARSIRGIFTDVFNNRIDFYASEFENALSSASGGANFRIRGQPWTSTWNNNGWSGNWASGWVDLATRTNNSTAIHSAQWTGNNRNRRAFRIYQSFMTGNSTNATFRNNSIIVYLHSLPLPNIIEAIAKRCGTLDSITIPFTAPLESGDSIFAVSYNLRGAIGKMPPINFDPIITPTANFGPNNPMRIAVEDVRGSLNSLEDLPIAITWQSRHLNSENAEEFILRVRRADTLRLTTTVTNPRCYGYSDGRIRVSPTGGRPFDGGRYHVQIRKLNNPFARDLAIVSPTVFSIDTMTTVPITFTNLSSGTYIISVQDRDRMDTVIDTVVLFTDHLPIDVRIDSLPLRYFPSEGTFNVRRGGLTVNPNSINSNLRYAWNGGSFSTNNVFHPPSGTTLRISVMDSTMVVDYVPTPPPIDGGGFVVTGPKTERPRGCEREITKVIREDTLHRPTITIAQNPFCQTSPTGILRAIQHQKDTLENSSFSWYRNGILLSNTGSTLYGVLPGHYRLCINYRGASSCTTIELNPQPMQITVVESSDLRCHGDFSGMVVLRVEQGSRNFMWNDNTFSDTIRIEGLPAQPQITIRDLGDSTRCYIEMTVNLTQPNPIAITPTISNVRCYQGNTGSIALSISGGTQPFAVAWKQEGEVFLSNGNNTVFPNLFAGGYAFKVTDGNDCIMETGLIEVTQPKRLQIDTIIADSVTGWGSSTGKIRANVSGGTTPYTFTWAHRKTGIVFATESINALTDIPTGWYDLTVTDHNSCITFAYVYVPTPDSLTHSYTIVHCTYFGSENGVITPTKTDGKITVTVRGGVKPYRFVWSKNGTVVQETISPDSIDILRDREGGIYTLLVIDRNGYYFRDTFEIIQRLPLVSRIEQIHIISCNNEQDASLEVTFKGGTPGYYRVIWQRSENGQWHTIRDTTFNEAGTDSLSNIGIGQYRVEVRDSFAYRPSYDLFEVSQPDPLHIASEVQILTRVDVYDAWIEVTVSGGRRPYTFSWTKDGVAFSTDTILKNLLPGMYTFHISDSMNCFATKTFLINEINDIEIVAEITHRSHRVASQGILTTQDTMPDGRIELRITGGVYPYTVEWFLEGTSIDITGQIATGLVQGNYQVRITDAVGNVAMDGFYIHQRPPLIARIDSVVHVSCFGNADGFLRATVTGGTPPHTFTWNTSSLDNTPIIKGLTPRIYTIIVTDSMGRQSNYSVEIREPNVLTVAVSQSNINCWGNPSGAFTLTPSGGNPPFLFSNDEQQIPRNTFTVSNLYAGYYYANIIDQRGCSQSVSIELTQPERLSVIAEIQHPVCYGYSDGSIAIKPIGGTEPHDIIWLNHPQQELTITGLRAGIFNLRLHDGNNCRKDTNFVLIDPPKLVIQSLAQSVVLCAGQHHRPVPQPDTLNFQWWSPELRFTSNEQSPKLHSGIYFVRALNQHLCYAKDSILIIQAPDTVVAQFWLNSDVFINEITTIVHVSYPVPDSALWVIPDNVEIVSYSFEYIGLIFHEQGEHTIGLIAYKGDCVDYLETQITVNSERQDVFMQSSPTLFDYAFVSPNPSRDYFELRFRTRRDADLLIQLFRANTAQQPVRTFRRNARAYQTETEVVSVQNLPPGTYVLTIQTNTDRQVLKLIIL